MRSLDSSERWTYAKAGVDRVAISQLHKMVCSLRVNRRIVVEGPGGYAGIIRIKGLKLALHVDGVGTKTLLASEPEEFRAIGIDAVAMNVNDIICVGARPLAVLDYIALQNPMPKVVENIVNGIKEACSEVGAELVGGETAIMPELFSEESYLDVVAACVGVVVYGPLPGNLKAGDQLIGLASSGLHSNGFSLVRKLLLKDRGYRLDDYIPSLGKKLREELLKPTRIYVKPLMKLFRYGPKPIAVAHITGGGFLKTKRITRGRKLALIFDSLPRPPRIFELIQEEGNVDELEMYKTFNMGVGMVLCVRGSQAQEAAKKLNRTGILASIVGRVERGEGVYIGERRLDE